MLFPRVAPLFFCAVFSSCNTELTDPLAAPEAGGLRLDGSISSATVPVGQTHTLTFQLRNLTDQSMTLTFSSGCQVTLFIESVSGQNVYPPGGGYTCTTAVSSLTLLPAHVVMSFLQVYGGPPPAFDIYVGQPLPKGRYRAYAILEENSSGVELRSQYVEFEVR